MIVRSVFLSLTHVSCLLGCFFPLHVSVVFPACFRRVSGMPPISTVYVCGVDMVLLLCVRSLVVSFWVLLFLFMARSDASDFLAIRERSPRRMLGPVRLCCVLSLCLCLFAWCYLLRAARPRALVLAFAAICCICAAAMSRGAPPLSCTYRIFVRWLSAIWLGSLVIFFAWGCRR